MPSETEAVVFDFNGTMIFDSPIHEAVWKDYIPAHGGVLGSEEEYSKILFGCSNRFILTHYFKDLSEADIARMTYEKEAEYRRRCAVDEKAFRLVDGLRDFLDALKAAGVPMTIATGSERLNVEFYFSSEKLGLGRWFDRSLVVYDDDTFPGKPAPDVYLRACEKIGVPPSRCLVFEDSVSGVTSAHAAGAGRVIAVGRDSERVRAAAGFVDSAIPDFSGWRELPEVREILG